MVLLAKVPGTCRLQTQVTVKPGMYRSSSPSKHFVGGNAGPISVEMPLWRSE